MLLHQVLPTREQCKDGMRTNIVPAWVGCLRLHQAHEPCSRWRADQGVILLGIRPSDAASAPPRPAGGGVQGVRRRCRRQCDLAGRWQSAAGSEAFCCCSSSCCRIELTPWGLDASFTTASSVCSDEGISPFTGATSIEARSWLVTPYSEALGGPCRVARFLLSLESHRTPLAGLGPAALSRREEA